MSSLKINLIPKTLDSDSWLWLLTLTPDSVSWLRLLTPSPDSDSWLRLPTLTPTLSPDSGSRLRLLNPTPDFFWNLYKFGEVCDCDCDYCDCDYCDYCDCYLGKVKSTPESFDLDWSLTKISTMLITSQLAPVTSCWYTCHANCEDYYLCVSCYTLL